MKPMNIGRMNQRIEFYTNSLTEDEMGQNINEWSVFKKVWADITPKSGSEKNEAGELVAETVYTIRIRYLKGITQDMLILYRNRWLEIKSILNLFERDRTMELECRECLRKEDDNE